MAKNKAPATDNKNYTTEQQYARKGQEKKRSTKPAGADASTIDGIEKFIVGQISEKYNPWKNNDMTEDDLAEDIFEQCGRYIRYCENGWMVWSAEDGCWKGEEYGEPVVQWIVRHFGRLLGESATEEYAEGLRYARHVRNSNGINAVMTILKRDKRIATSRRNFDINHEVLNCKGDLYNLRTGEIRKAEPEDNITKSCKYSPAEKTDAQMLPPQFHDFMKKVTSKDGVERPDLMLWILSYFGYSLTGETGASFFVNFHGSGQNGKSVLLKLMMAIFGDYAAPIHQDIVIENRFASQFLLSNLPGLRLGVLADAGEGQLNMKLLKEITTGEPMTAPVKFKDDMKFSSSCKLAVGSNHRLTLRNTGMDAKRRVRMIPFDYIVPDDEIVPDLEKKLLEEAPEILRCLIFCANKYYEMGGGAKAFPKCEVIDQASKEYLESQDLVGRWVKDNTEASFGYDVSLDDMYKNFQAWCAGEGIKKVMGKNKFGEHLSVHLKEKKHTNKGTVYQNIKLTGASPPIPGSGSG